VRFWDSSAIVPLVCREVESSRCRAWLRADPVIVVWAFTAPEVVSALCRKRREGRLNQRIFVAAKARPHKIEQAWSEVVSYEAVRARARRLLETHPLSAADALQLAAALVMTEERPAGIEFVTFDTKLAEAANKEGFKLLPS